MKLVTGTRETNDIEKAIGSKLKVNQRWRKEYLEIWQLPD